MTTYRSIFSLLSSYGLLLVANGLFGTIVSIRTKTEAFPDSIIGLVMAGYFVGLLLSSFYAIKIVAYIGHIRAFATFASVASTVALAHLLWVNPPLWGVLRVLSGFCMGGMVIVTEGWLNERADNNNRGTILSLYMVTTYACAGSAQLMMMLGNPDGFKLFVIVSILYSFALIPILMTQSKAPAPASAHRPDIKRLYRATPVGLIGTFVVGYVNGIFYGLTPVFAYSIGLDIQQTAIFIALGIMSGMLLQFPLGKLSDKIDRRWVLVFSAFMTAIACYLLYRSDGNNLTLLYCSAIFYGSTAFSINPICVAHTNDLAPSDERTQTASGLLMFYGVGAVVGPVLAGFVMSYDVHLIYAMSGAVTLTFALYTLLRLKIKPRHQQQSKHEFRPFTIQSPARKLSFDEATERQPSAKK